MIKITEELLEEFDKVDQELNKEIQEFVYHVQQQRAQAIGALIKGFLSDKDYPKDKQISIKDGYIIFLDNEEIQKESDSE